MMSFSDYNNFLDDEKFLRMHPDLTHSVAKTQLSLAAAMLIGKLVELEVVTSHDVGLCAKFIFSTICLPGRLRALHCMVWFADDKICRHSGLSWMIKILKRLDEKIQEKGSAVWMACSPQRIRTALDYYLDRQIVKTTRSTPGALKERIRMLKRGPKLEFREV